VEVDEVWERRLSSDGLSLRLESDMMASSGKSGKEVRVEVGGADTGQQRQPFDGLVYKYAGNGRLGRLIT